MEFSALKLKEVILVKPKRFNDARGFFLESYHKQRFADNGLAVEFVQDNHSRSTKGILRGLHYQVAPLGQGKLVRVVRGAIFDVAVDIREKSATYGQWVGAELNEENNHMLYIPPDFAHGFCTLQDNTDVVYKVTQPYSPEHDKGIAWDDPDINIQWPSIGVPYVLSEKDQKNPKLNNR